jgi:hypothetical protein
MDLQIKKVNKNLFIIHDNENQNPIIKISEIVSPFGLEKYNNNNYINFQVDTDRDYHTNLLYDLNKIETYFINYVSTIDQSLEFIPILKTTKNYKPLWKIKIKEIKYNYNYKGVHDIEVSLNTLWIKNNKAGLVWDLKSISNIY